MIEIYERIKYILQKNNINDSELGKILGLKKSPMTDWKNGKSKPTLEQIILICEKFAISYKWLITGKEDNELLTQEEKEILEEYRKLDDEGKRYLRYAIELSKFKKNS